MRRVERRAGHRNDPVVAPIMVRDVSAEAHGETNADDPRWLAHDATVVARTDEVGPTSLPDRALSCHGWGAYGSRTLRRASSST